MNWEKLLNNGRLRGSKRDSIEDVRNDFESDFGRIIFSEAMRRMHDKTQVFPLTSDDHIHSRLTHSMEVMAIGHSLGIRICEKKEFQEMVGKAKTDLFREIPVILKNACLVHDIGNPPFGHFGETVIQNYFENYFKTKSAVKLKKVEQEDFIRFDGNAQGFRVLTKLQVLDDEVGLNLTYATLGSYIKYPNFGKINKNKIAKKKRGVFQSEIKHFKQISEECGLKIKNEIVRHPLCYLMEAADSICYLVMDIEDGFSKGWYNLSSLGKKLESVKGIKTQVKKLEKENIGYGKEITKMVKFRIYLIQRLVNLTVNNFIKNLPLISEGKYNKELIFDDPNDLAQTLKTFCLNDIFSKREITSLELTGHSVLKGLLDYYIEFVFHSEKQYRERAQGLISDSILRIAFIENKLPENSKMDELNDYYKLRIIVDFITGMTDQFALNHYQKLSGQKIN
jgi:dGTPase